MNILEVSHITLLNSKNDFDSAYLDDVSTISLAIVSSNLPTVVCLSELVSKYLSPNSSGTICVLSRVNSHSSFNLHLIPTNNKRI